ncbi:MAG: hypothetical protein ACE5HI_09925 [bacterium]
MKEGKKLKISYEDLADPKVDEIIARTKRFKENILSGAFEKKPQKTRPGNRRWLQFALVACISAFVFWGAFKVIDYTFFAPKDKYIEIGNSRYLVSKEAQKYLEFLDESDYEKTKSVLIIQEPHYNLGQQFNLYKGLDVFFKDNPSLIAKTIFLSEGLPTNQSLSVQPLIEVEPRPNEKTIKEVLSSFLITGYIAYEWKYQNDIPILGIENKQLYDRCARLWIEVQDKPDDFSTARNWENLVFARNQSMAQALFNSIGVYENPILFVGGLHLRDRDNENLGLYDYFKEKKIGYTFLSALSDRSESVVDLEENIITYTELFKSQQASDYNTYIQWLIYENRIHSGVTVAPSPQAAADLLKTSEENKDSDKESESDKGSGGKDKGNSGKGKGNSGKDKGSGGKNNGGSGKDNGSGGKDNGDGGSNKNNGNQVSGNGNKNPPKTTDGKDFNPNEWEKGSQVSKQVNKGKHKGSTSTETEYTNKETGQKQWRHTITNKNGKVVHDHFRPFPKH